MSNNVEKKEEEISIKCPSCQKGTITIGKTIYDVPDGDKLLIMKFECDNCDFHRSDVVPLETKMEAGVMTLKITCEEELKSKIYRSRTGKLEIPELELIVEPGPRADFYYTNVEGILYRFENAVSIYRNQLDKNDPQVREIDGILKGLKKAMKGQLEFTLIVTDPIGGSYIVPIDKSKYTFEKSDLKENDVEI